MRILTVRQPWAWAIIHGGKDVENRVRNIAGSYRGPVAIHVGLTFPYTRDCNAVRDVIGSWPPVADRWDNVVGAGRIIGVVDLVDVHHPNDRWGCPPSPGDLLPMCSEWAEKGAHHLVFRNPRALDEPILYRGALGLRHLDDDTTARILAQIGGTDA